MALSFWHITLIGIVAGYIGCGILFFALKRTSGKLYKSLVFLFAASMFGITSHTIIPIFGLNHLDISSNWWNFVPFSFAGAMFLVIFYLKKLINVLEEVQEEAEQNINSLNKLNHAQKLQATKVR